MIKNIFTLLLIFFLFHLNLASQYSLTTSNSQNYNHLTGGVILDESSPWQHYSYDVYNGVSIGFDFEMGGIIFDSIHLAEDGYAIFKTDTIKFFISIYDSDLVNFNNDPNSSPIIYKTEGAIGNRIFKCEYKTVGFENDTEVNDSVSFQLWLYENCNEFEVRIGESSIDSDVFWNGFSGPYIGYGEYDIYSFTRLAGDPLAPSLSTSGTNTLDSAPPVGIVYKFSNCTNDLVSSPKSELSIYPVPAKDYIYIKSPSLKLSSEIMLYNLNGTKLNKLNIQLENEIAKIDCSTLNPGVYILKINNSGGFFHTSRIIIE